MTAPTRRDGPVPDAHRPGRVVVVAGTATEIGKTWVGARLAEALRVNGFRVAARKPVQSFEPGAGPTDAEVLAAASGEEPEVVCPSHRWYPVAVAPPMAADVLGRPPIRLADLVAELAWPSPVAEVGLVETAGGVRSPLADDGDTVALATAIAADLVVLVADAGLGTINAVRLAADVLADAAVPVVVVLNRFASDDDLHRRNAAWLRAEGRIVRTDVEHLVADVAGAR
ncbi:MAG: ATP-dependent dethiobiotin synthetase BioD [Acidimicrobiales bacterium]